MSNRLDTVYFGAAIERTPAVMTQQEQICKTYQLLPREELHLTFGFLGKLSQEQVDTLARRLAEANPPTLPALAPIGLGGAFQADGTAYPWNELSNRDPLTVPRVLWWALQRDSKILRLREILATIVEELRLPFPSGGLPFSPHVTLGSAGPRDASQEEFALWDVHTLSKEANISTHPVPGELVVARLHLTSVAVHPDSLARIA